MGSNFKHYSDNLTAALDTGNREFADEIIAAVMHSNNLTEEEQAELFADYQLAIDGGQI